MTTKPRISKADGRLSTKVPPTTKPSPVIKPPKVIDGDLDEAAFGKRKKIINPRVVKD